eukprot:TRINITY_DN9701_c0_g2_i1.p1 TRINITY_DN9701_c0_g2~~TRINITY_DN9701_c0_g2_i1.p1  ORF type:complete len:373 (+),score=130.54 TRINITY_DN9701_c0_g2_i1:88-1206(+)
MAKGNTVSRATKERLQRQRGQPKRERVKRGMDARGVDAHRGGKKAKQRVAGGGEQPAVHPKSRKAKQLWRQFGRDKQKTERLRGALRRDRARQLRWRWFRDRVADLPTDLLVAPQVEQFVVEYVKRNDEALKEMREKREAKARHRSAVPPAAGQEREVLGVREMEARQAEQGELEGPALGTKAGLRLLRAWDGELHTMQTVPSAKLRVSGSVDSYRPFTMGAAPVAKKRAERAGGPAAHGAKVVREARAGRVAMTQDLQARRREQRLKELRGAPAAGDAPQQGSPAAAPATGAAAAGRSGGIKRKARPGTKARRIAKVRAKLAAAAASEAAAEAQPAAKPPPAAQAFQFAPPQLQPGGFGAAFGVSNNPFKA